MKIFKPIGKYIVKNLPSILSIAGASGLVVTAVLTAKATPKAKEIFEEMHKADEPGKTSVLTVVTAAKPYIPAVTVGTISMFCILAANNIHVRRYLSLCKMYNRLADEYSMFKIASLAQAGEDALSAAGGSLLATRTSEESIELDENGEVVHWFYDVHSMTWYRSTWNKVKDAADHINDTYAYNGFASLFDYYMELGIHDKPLDHAIGWDIERVMNEYECPFIPFEYSEKISFDGSKAFAVWFPIEPVLEVDSIWA